MDDAAAREAEIPEPSLLVMGYLSGQPPTIGIVCERKVIVRNVSGIEAPLLHCACYYAFNIQEPKGFSSFFKSLYRDVLHID